MNKKFLKGALALFASIFMAVSCSNKDTSGPGDTKPSVSKSDVETFLKRLDSDESLTAKDSTLADGNTFAVTLSATTQTKTVDDIKGVIVAKLTAANNLQAVTANDISDNRLAVDADNKAVEYTITLKPANGYNIGGFGTVKVVVTPKASEKWKKININKAKFTEEIKKALGTQVGEFPVTTVDPSWASKKITVAVTQSSSFNGGSKAAATKTALENKYDNVITVLADLGISTTDKAIATDTSGNDLTGTLSNCKLSGLYSIDNDIGSTATAVDNVEIKLTASQAWS